MSNWPNQAFLMPLGYDEFGHPGESGNALDEMSQEEVLFEFVGRSPTPMKPSLYPDYTAPVDNNHRNSPGILTSPLFNNPMQIGSDYHSRTLTAKQGYSQSDIEALMVKAIMSDQKVKIWYNAESDNFVEEVRNISPLNIRVTKKGKYIVTSINGFHEIRTYRLDRISRIKELFIPAFKDPQYSNYYAWLAPRQKPQTESLEPSEDDIQTDDSDPTVEVEPVVLKEDTNPEDKPFTAFRKTLVFRELEASEDEDYEPGLQLLNFNEIVTSMFNNLMDYVDIDEEDDLKDLKDGIDQLEGLLIPFSYESFEVADSSNLESTFDFMEEVVSKFSDSEKFSQIEEDFMDYLSKIKDGVNSLKGFVVDE